MRLLYLNERERVREGDPPEGGPQKITPGEDGWSGYGTPPPSDVLAQIPWERPEHPDLN